MLEVVVADDDVVAVGGQMRDLAHAEVVPPAGADQLVDVHVGQGVHAALLDVVV